MGWSAARGRVDDGPGPAGRVPPLIRPDGRAGRRIGLAVTALLPIGTVVAPVAEAAAPNGPKVVIVSGPVGSFNRH